MSGCFAGVALLFDATQPDLCANASKHPGNNVRDEEVLGSNPVTPILVSVGLSVFPRGLSVVEPSARLGGQLWQRVVFVELGVAVRDRCEGQQAGLGAAAEPRRRPR